MADINECIDRMTSFLLWDNVEDGAIDYSEDEIDRYGKDAMLHNVIINYDDDFGIEFFEGEESIGLFKVADLKNAYVASAKKSKSQPTFTDMVAKQRDKNKGIKKNEYSIGNNVDFLFDIIAKYNEIKDAHYGDLRMNLINAPNSPLGNDWCEELDKAMDKASKGIEKLRDVLYEIHRLDENGMFMKEVEKPFSL